MTNENIKSPKLKKLQNKVKAGDKSALESFWREIEENGAPLIEDIEGDNEHKLVTFIVKEEEGVKQFVVASFISGYILKDNILDRLEGTDIYYRSYKVQNGVRDNYFIGKDIPLDFEQVFDNWDKYGKRCVTDPYNKKQFVSPADDEPGGDHEEITSILELPDAVKQPWIESQEDVPKGSLKEIRMSSSLLNNERRIWIYTPSGYSKNSKPYHLLLTFDGFTYTQTIPTPTILDNLIAKEEIPPTIAVFVGNASSKSRFSELMCNETFGKFLSEELIPWVQTNYNVTKDPLQTVIAGSSLGGLAASFIGMKYPQIFGNVLSQSGAYWWSPEDEEEKEWLTREFMKKDKLPLKIYADVGKLEHFEGMVTTNRNFRDMLKEKGYNYCYKEFMGGHQPLCWRGTLSDGLIELIGTKK
ncbi:enterochelin esterase [Dethiothermospora halolimnae]|uniref:enterochelin esterase n=1 Tax=Dethiothermospora halolimnae TaxID=3114390 RepID=UPI003CCC015D